MITKYYKCTLLTDVVLNSSLATEGNMTSLDYIPGSNFLGIVASKFYQQNIDEILAYQLFHSDKVRFGDATISINDELTVPVPAAYFQDKLHNDPLKDAIYVHHLTKKSPLQLKQKREGYITPSGKWIKKVERTFSLKSAYDVEERRSAEGKMFGFEALKAGQAFVFTVQYDQAAYVLEVEGRLLGIQRIGKSKTAEFGQVIISKMEGLNTKITSVKNNDYVVVYAASNLCFFNEYGQPHFQPTANDLGVIGGKICWQQSQVRTYTYSPWNFKRNTTNAQRDCIAKGSVFYISKDENTELEFDASKTNVGEYQAEGLGSIIYNPAFLEADVNGIAKLKYTLAELKNIKKVVIAKKTPLVEFLVLKQKEKKQQHALSEAIHKSIYNNEIYSELEKINFFKIVTPSQWGGIRTYATNEQDWGSLENKLFANKTGFLMHGVADEKIWGKQGGQLRNKLKDILKANQSHGTQFVVKFAAEMAKIASKTAKKSK
jgi:hypothetical protein